MNDVSNIIVNLRAKEDSLKTNLSSAREKLIFQLKLSTELNVVTAKWINPLDLYSRKIYISSASINKT